MSEEVVNAAIVVPWTIVSRPIYIDLMLLDSRSRFLP